MACTTTGTDCEAFGAPTNLHTNPSANVSSVASAADGTITITFSTAAGVPATASKIELVPSSASTGAIAALDLSAAANAGAAYTWRCRPGSSSGVEAKFLPAVCRAVASS